MGRERREMERAWGVRWDREGKRSLLSVDCSEAEEFDTRVFRTSLQS